MTAIAQLEAIDKLKRDVRASAETLGEREARFLVDAYYAIQEHRIEAQNQVRSLAANEEPNAILGWLFDQHYVIEREIAKALDTYSGAHEAGRWVRSLYGVGPIIAAGLLAHIDITQAPTVGHIWRFAGLDPTVTWDKGQKRPWNAALKVLTWKMGEALVKVSARPCIPGSPSAASLESAVEGERAVDNESTDEDERAVSNEGTVESERADTNESAMGHERAVKRASTVKTERAAPHESTAIEERPRCVDGCMNYGHVYIARKLLEVARNEQGLFADQAAASLAKKSYGKTTDAFKHYSARKLPPARIHARAKRYAVKLLLAHYHHVAYELHYGELPPKPYVIEHLGHVKYIGPPNWPMTV